MLTKEQLQKLGVPDTAITSTLEAIAADIKATIDGSYVPKEKMDSILEKNKALDAQVTERDTQIAKLSALSGDAEKFKSEAEKAAAANAEQKQQFEKEMADKDKKLAVQLALIADNCVDPSEVAGKFNLEQVILDKDGKLIGGYDTQRDAIKTEKAYYFAAQSSKPEGENKPAGGGLPPGWKPMGQTPAQEPDGEQLSGPEAEAIRMAKEMAASFKSGEGLAAKAANHYFGAQTAAPAAETK